jgi:hypothetical protein
VPLHVLQRVDAGVGTHDHHRMIEGGTVVLLRHVYTVVDGKRVDMTRSDRSDRRKTEEETDDALMRLQQ